MGLTYAVASNYLGRVVNQKPVDEKIAIQGNIAFNQAVVLNSAEENTAVIIKLLCEAYSELLVDKIFFV